MGLGPGCTLHLDHSTMLGKHLISLKRTEAPRQSGLSTCGKEVEAGDRRPAKRPTLG